MGHYFDLHNPVAWVLWVLVFVVLVGLLQRILDAVIGVSERHEEREDLDENEDGPNK